MPFDAASAAEVTARDRMVRLRNFLANDVPDEHFDMSDWFCGTSACIGGWCDRLFNNGVLRAWPCAASDLGLSPDDAIELFFMKKTPRNFDEVTREGAVAVLDHYLATGEIDWSVA